MCVQENGSTTDCTTTKNPGLFPTFVATTEAKEVVVNAGGVIQLTLNNIGGDSANKTVTFTPVVNETSIGWNVTTTVTNEAIKGAFLKNSVATTTAPATGG
jgi:hypothetical protein